LREVILFWPVLMQSLQEYWMKS